MISTHKQANVTVIRVTEARLSASNAPEFRRSILALVENGESQLVVDLQNVAFIDSSGLGALVALFKQIGMRGELAIANLSPAVAQLFRLTRMDRVFRIYPNVDASIAGLQAA